jgi:hypothetical protein
MPFSKPAHIRFAYPVVQSVSRKPNYVEFLHINLLEDHPLYCTTCHRHRRKRSKEYCRRAAILELLVLKSFILKSDGLIYCVYMKNHVPTRVEIPRYFRAVYALLLSTDGHSIMREGKKGQDVKT